LNYEGAKIMTNERLKELLIEFVEEQDDTKEDEWYLTDRDLYEVVMNNFKDFLKRKKIKL
jgi:hypothetical protein